MNTNKKRKLLKLLQRKSRSFLNIHKKLTTKNTIFSILGYIAFLISFFIFFNSSFVLSEDIIIIKANVTKTTTIQVIGGINGVKSMTLNGSPMTPATKITPKIGDNEIIVTYNSPITDCSKILMNSKATFIDLSDFDTSQCSMFTNFFYGCSALTSIILGDNFITSNALDMAGMFNGFGSSNSKISFDFSRLDTSKVTNMKEMFKSSKFRILDLTGFDTSNVNNMQGMFSSCTKLISMNLSSFDTSKVTTMNNMFALVTGLISLDITNFKLDSLTECNQMFYQMKGKLKFCNNNKEDYAKIKTAISQIDSGGDCNDPCFNNKTNFFFDGNCYNSCLETTKYFYEYESECYEKCPKLTEENPKNPYTCIDIIDCTKTYYNFEKTACINKVPEGFYCDDEIKRTIDKCQDKCKTCDLDSVKEDRCIQCNSDNSYFEVEKDIDSENYIDCFNELHEGYYFEENKYKKCYESCKYCSDLGNNIQHKCIECKSGMIKEFESNCYNKCPENQYYYFDDSNEYHCDSNCPEGYKLITSKNKCTKDCRNESPYIYEYEGKCLEECPQNYHAPNDDKICVVALICDYYYNYEYTGCLTEVPDGYFCNDTEKKTIDKCKPKCKTCTLDSHNNNLCTDCNEENGYYKIEEDEINTQIECYNIIPEGYYLDKDDLKLKKCYKACKNCTSLGSVEEQLCTECYEDFTLNGTNCYEICPYFYYFDSSKEYFCTSDDQCPIERSKLIVDKNECVEECINEYKFEFDNKCYLECPQNSYYNYEQTNCIDKIPEGYYLNDTQTIDKCDSKCKECDINSVFDNVCISCNNSLGFYKKEDDLGINQYYDCFTGEQNGYYFLDNEYKRCYKTCKKCDELGEIKNNKCTECFSNSTLNGTNCYEICQSYHYFDVTGEYHCTLDKVCPDYRSKLIVDKGECVEECIDEYKFEFDNKCYSECPIGTYYNYTQDGCIDNIPIGFYMNDSLKRTIDKCDIKCESECILDESINNILCKNCNNEISYYKKEVDNEKYGYYDCYTGKIEKYFIDNTNNMYKKCFAACKYCNELGDDLNHKCTDCFSGYTFNDTNCYKICDYFYYFDSNGIYHCTEKDECPNDFPNKIIEKKTCVSNCSNDPIFKYNHNNICYEACPDKTKISDKNPYICEDLLICPKYYNYEHTQCIDTIPDGFYLNDSLAKTIDKCINKCSKCDKTSVDLEKCISCNNVDNFYKKENDETNMDNYISCYNSSFEGFYLDEKYKSYNKCFEKCKNCDGKGNITNHKCTECNENFTLNGTNCYEICPYYFFFDSNGVYHCTTEEKCPNKYNYIPEKKQCIDECKNDNIYKYVHKGICLDAPYIPFCNDTSMFIEKETGDCTEDCEAYDFLSNYCSLRNNDANNHDYIISKLIDSIENENLNELISDMINGTNDGYLILEDNINYHLTIIKQNNLMMNSISNVSSIDLGDCEYKLKEKYNISQDLPLILLKIDYFMNYSLIPLILYEIFNPITKKKLNLSICENNILNINVPTVVINESTLYKYDPNSNYYMDECSSTSSEIEYDMILSDRQNYFIINNLSICENNCVFKGYDTKEKKSLCVCYIKTKSFAISELLGITDLFFNKFHISEKGIIHSIKCISTLLSKEGLIKNIAFYIHILLSIILLVCCILFFRKGFNSLINIIQEIMMEKEKKAKEEVLKFYKPEEPSIDIDKKNLDKMIKSRTPKNLRNDFKEAIPKYDINSQENYTNDQKSINKLEIYKIRGSEKSQTYQLETEKDYNYSEFEMNSLNFQDAIGVDIRTFRQIYVSFIFYNHPYFFIFNTSNVYNSIYIKLSLLLISFSLHYFVNSLFITKEIIHEVYETGNAKYINKFIMYIIISSIICYAMDKIIKFIFLSDYNILSIYKEALFNNAKIRAKQVRKVLLIKYVLFYIIGIIYIIFSGYYLSIFGAVYRNTQFILIKNIILSYAISSIFPFIIIIIPSLLRRYALKDSTRGWVFNISRYLQYL